MSDQARKALHFRDLHVPGNPLVLFNAWDAGSAKAVDAGGAKAIATSSWSVADANGFADGEQLPLPFAIENLRRIIGVTDLPVTVDLESGYGETAEAVRSSIALAIDVCAVGCNLEDSVPGDGRLRSRADQVIRIRSARRAAEVARLPFFINARTDVFLRRPAAQHDSTMLNEALERAKHYRDAGADGIFAPGLVDIRLIAQLAAASPLPLNIMLQEETPPMKNLADHGVARVSHGPGPYLLAMRALEAAARTAFHRVASP
ncbi:MAG TPA: isocitrate lyase/phosphoenolpyruvate mutase family protein [Steroidobacteraceae bacterium]|nr:isocitrate lyase/phosphoenolpyruvate mutase family protein [Steroidobacteraceae bacterium]